MSPRDYGKVRCPRCGEWYGLDETHVCASAAPLTLGATADPATVPDLDRPLVPGLTWVVPLESRPIALGPSTDRPEIRPALALDADRYWSHARHGLTVGRARRDLDTAARDYALQPAPTTGAIPVLVAELSQAAAAWDKAITNAAKDMS